MVLEQELPLTERDLHYIKRHCCLNFLCHNAIYNTKTATLQKYRETIQLSGKLVLIICLDSLHGAV